MEEKCTLSDKELDERIRRLRELIAQAEMFRGVLERLLLERAQRTGKGTRGAKIRARLAEKSRKPA
jgi:hypothetical protein